MSRRLYDHIKLDDVFDLYYANTGNYDWRTKKGKPEEWKYSLEQIRAHFDFGSINNIIDRVYRTVGTPGKRTGIPGASDARHPTSTREPIPATNGNNGHVEVRVARSALSTQIVVSAMSSPKVADAVHEVAVGLARAMGYPAAPSKLDVMTFLSKVTAKL